MQRRSMTTERPDILIKGTTDATSAPYCKSLSCRQLAERVRMTGSHLSHSDTW